MKHRLSLDMEIVFEAPFHCGSGEGSFLIDRLICRDSQNRPFIPASTLKGIIRENCEKISRLFGFKEPSNPHCVDIRSKGLAGFEPWNEIKSPVDRMFGTKFEDGSLFFRNACLSEETTLIENKTRIARNRILLTARTHHLFSSEFCHNFRFRSKIDGWHNDLMQFDEEQPPFDYCLLIAGILAVESIGGNKSTGSGKLIAPINLSGCYNGRPIDLDEILTLLELGGES